MKKLKTALEDCTAVCILEGFQKQEHMMLVDTILKELGKFNEFFDNFLACWLFKKLVKFFFFFAIFIFFFKKKFQVVLKLNWLPRKGTLSFRQIILFVNTFNHSPQIQSWTMILLFKWMVMQTQKMNRKFLREIDSPFSFFSMSFQYSFRFQSFIKAQRSNRRRKIRNNYWWVFQNYWIIADRKISHWFGKSFAWNFLYFEKTT